MLEIPPSMFLMLPYFWPFLPIALWTNPYFYLSRISIAMPRNHNLEDLYESAYLQPGLIYENDVMQQGAPEQNAGIEGKHPAPEDDQSLGDYDLRRSILKLQEWVMYIDHKFSSTVDELGGMVGFLTEMVNKMMEDEMIRSNGGTSKADETESDAEITDDDISAEVDGLGNNPMNQKGFETVNKNEKQ